MSTDPSDRGRKVHAELFAHLPMLPPPPRPIVDYTNCDECPLLAICLASCPGGGFARLYSEFKRLGGEFPSEDVSDEIHALIERRKAVRKIAHALPVRRYFPPWRDASISCFHCFQLEFCRGACPAFDIVLSTVKKRRKSTR